MLPLNRRTTTFALLLLFMFSVIHKVSFGQQPEVVVMVSGPWAYVADPSPSPTPPRLAIVAPVTPHHYAASIFSGPRADHFPNQPTVPTGKYYLEIPNLVHCTAVQSPPDTFNIPVPMDKIKLAVDGPGQRYAFSLPVPCSYEAYMHSESRIDTNAISLDPAAGTPKKKYTTWMVLHYQVSTVADATLSGHSDDNTRSFHDSMSFTKLGHFAPAISIVLGSQDPLGSDSDCDGMSGHSVKDAASVFGQVVHTQFPEVIQGTQSDTYLDYCVDATQLLDKKTLGLVLLDIDQVESVLRTRERSRVPYANETLTRIRDTIKLDRKKLPPEVDQELKDIKKELDRLSAAKNDALQSHADKGEGMQKVRSLVQTQYYSIKTAAGAGDCRGSQLNVTTSP